MSAPKDDAPKDRTAGDDPSARRIYQDLMDRLNQSHFAPDPGTFLSLILTPICVVTAGAEVWLRTEDDLRQSFDNLTSYIRDNGVTAYLRICTAARFVDDATIHGRHESHVMQGMEALIPTFVVHTTLVRDAQGWKAASFDTLDQGIGALQDVLARTRNGTSAGQRKRGQTDA